MSMELINTHYYLVSVIGIFLAFGVFTGSDERYCSSIQSGLYYDSVL